MPIDGKFDAANSAHFFKAYHYYINLDCGLWTLLRLLSSRSAALGILDEGTPTFTLRIRKGRYYKLLRLAGRIIGAKLAKRLGKDQCVMLLPDKGQLAMWCYPGYARIFDLEEGRVLNIFESVEGCQRNAFEYVTSKQEALGELGVAPKILSNNPSGCIYEEELHQGVPLERTTDDKSIYDEVQRIFVLVRAMQASDSSRQTTWKEVSARLNGDQLSRNVDNELHEAGKVMQWLMEKSSAIEGSKEAEIQLYLSHGDLSPRNVLEKSDKSLVFIDWQTVGHRPHDYDLYHYAFVWLKDFCRDSSTEERLFECLLELTCAEESDQVRETMVQFQAFFIVTRREYFMRMETDDRRENIKQLRIVMSCCKIADRYAEFSHKALNSRK